MPYDSQVSRENIQARVPEVVSDALLTSLTDSSVALRLFRRLVVPSNETKFPILSALPSAYFVAGDTGQKQTTEAAWENRYLHVEEIAAIVPVPEAVIDDVNFDIWGSIRPLLEAAIARTLDNAILFGVNAPAAWADDANIRAAAVAAGNVVERGTASQAQGGVAEDFNQLFAKVEADGFEVNGVVANPVLRAVFRGARDTTGQLLADLNANTVLGAPLDTNSLRGLWPSAAVAEAIAGDFQQGVIGVRQDITYKLLDQAVITNEAGDVVFNLPQQDMVALRVVFRAGFAVANPITWEDTSPGSATRYPFATLRNAT